MGFSSSGGRSFVRSVACGSDLFEQQSELRDIWQAALAAMIPDDASTSRGKLSTFAELAAAVLWLGAHSVRRY
jgi:hypothetical protein